MVKFKPTSFWGEEGTTQAVIAGGKGMGVPRAVRMITTSRRGQ